LAIIYVHSIVEFDRAVFVALALVWVVQDGCSQGGCEGWKLGCDQIEDFLVQVDLEGAVVEKEFGYFAACSAERFEAGGAEGTAKVESDGLDQVRTPKDTICTADIWVKESLVEGSGYVIIIGQYPGRGEGGTEPPYVLVVAEEGVSECDFGLVEQVDEAVDRKGVLVDLLGGMTV
jgi:hypothetical protein